MYWRRSLWKTKSQLASTWGHRPQAPSYWTSELIGQQERDPCCRAKAADIKAYMSQIIIRDTRELSSESPRVLSQSARETEDVASLGAAESSSRRRHQRSVHCGRGKCIPPRAMPLGAAELSYSPSTEQRVISERRAVGTVRLYRLRASPLGAAELRYSPSR